MPRVKFSREKGNRSARDSGDLIEIRMPYEIERLE